MTEGVLHEGSRGTGHARVWIACLAIAAGVWLLAPSAGAVQLDRTTITLQSAQYDSQRNDTRFVYRVTTPSGQKPDYWVLGVGDCVSDAVILQSTTSPYSWVSSPFRGVRFSINSREQQFSLFLAGNWSTEAARVALGWNPTPVLTGSIDGPACAAPSISLAVLQGDSIAFPPVDGAGTYPATTHTVLRVTSSTTGWALGYTLAFSIPAQATLSVVEKVFQVALGSYLAASGTTDLSVSYALVVELGDFAGLPQGTYVITIAYTVSTN